MKIPQRSQYDFQAKSNRDSSFPVRASRHHVSVRNSFQAKSISCFEFVKPSLQSNQLRRRLHRAVEGDLRRRMTCDGALERAGAWIEAKSGTPKSNPNQNRQRRKKIKSYLRRLFFLRGSKRSRSGVRIDEVSRSPTQDLPWQIGADRCERYAKVCYSNTIKKCCINYTCLARATHFYG